MKVIKQT